GKIGEPATSEIIQMGQETEVVVGRGLRRPRHQVGERLVRERAGMGVDPFLHVAAERWIAGIVHLVGGGAVFSTVSEEPAAIVAKRTGRAKAVAGRRRTVGVKA